MQKKKSNKYPTIVKLFCPMHPHVCDKIVIHISQTEVNNKQQQSIETLQTNVTKEVSDFTRQLQENKDADMRINYTMLNVNSQFALEFNEFKTESRHIEKGIVNCGLHTGWTNGSVYKYITDEFRRPYTKTPIAFTSVSWWMSKTDKPNLVLYSRLTKVNTTHVIIRCYKTGGTLTGYVQNTYVDWITFPQ